MPIAIRFSLDMGWKLPSGGLYSTKVESVAIRFSLDMGWKDCVQYIQAGSGGGRNPLFAGYGLEGIKTKCLECVRAGVAIRFSLDMGWKFHQQGEFLVGIRRNPLFAGYGLEGVSFLIR